MAFSFYFKLALSNIVKNKKNYLPYVISNIVVIAIFFCFRNLIDNIAVYSSIGITIITSLLGFGVTVLALFSLIFMFYTNSFLFKRRQKELGLYNVLGMEKRHLSMMIGFEVVIVAVTSIACGLFFGALFYKLAELFLFKLLNQPLILGLHYSFEAFLFTVELFVTIFGLTFIYSIYQIRHVNAIHLMSGAKSGEKEPKTRHLLTLVGFVSLFAGYYLSQKAKYDPAAIFIFFLAVILVIIGTYCLFVAGSVALLKLLKKNNRFYYQPKHFTMISQMIYRMKQNAVGLANICILSTMVIVTLSTTTALYLSIEDLINQSYPQDVSIFLNSEIQETGVDEEGGTIYENLPIDLKKVDEEVRTLAKEYNVTLNDVNMYEQYSMSAKIDGADITLLSDESNNVMQVVYFVPQKYLGDLACVRDSDEIMVYQSEGAFDKLSSLTINNQSFDIVSTLDHINIPGIKAEAKKTGVVYVFLKDEATISSVIGMDFQEALRTRMGSVYQFNLSEEDEAVFYEQLTDRFHNNKQVYYTCRIESRRADSNDIFNLYGGLFFIGLFLGFTFMIATILIIYYKQISEGYDDASRYEVMQKVGMSKQEIKRSIRSQILSVFFLPLLVACCHMMFAFRLIKIILSFLHLTNTMLFMQACIGVVGVFAVSYCLIYLVTSKEYYKIVTLD